MTGAKLTPLGDLADLQAGVGFPRDLQGRNSGDYPLAKVGDISRVARAGRTTLFASDHYVDEADLRRLKARPIPPGSILFPKIGEAIRQNHRVIAGCPLLIDNNAMAAIPNARIESRYLYHYLRTVDFYALTSATTVPALRKSELERLMVPLQPRPEQRRIAEILDKADALRAKRRAALAQLDTLTQSIFLDMFGDPGSNPKGWPVKRLDEVCDLVNGRAFKPEEWEESGLPIIRIQNLNDPSKPFNYTTKALPERFRVKSGDILFSWSGTPGTSFGCFRWNGPEGWLNQHIFNVRLNGSLDGAFFINHVNLKLGELIAKAHGGVGLRHVTKAMVNETRLMVPPKDLQRQFATMTVNIERIRDRLMTSHASLDRLFSCLQHEAFHGGLVPMKCGQQTGTR